jgi:hypothetical protein
LLPEEEREVDCVKRFNVSCEVSRWIVFSLGRTAGGIGGTAVERQALPVGLRGEIDAVDLIVHLCTLALGEVSGGGTRKGGQKGEDDGNEEHHGEDGVIGSVCCMV